jgi:hypothetical protein
VGVKLQWQGMNEFKEALRKLPEHLADEASGIVLAAAQRVAGEVQANYPMGATGNLKHGVTVSQERGRVSTAGRVKSRAPHASWFEELSTGRRNPPKPRKTKRGWNRGIMPIAPKEQQAIPQFIRARARMRQDLKALLVREGFLVEDDAT